MLQAARLVVTFVRSVTLDEYCDNQMLRMAVERAILRPNPARWGKTLRKTGQTNGEKFQPLFAMALLASFSILHLSGSFL